MATERTVIRWLLDGDPAIRWQVMRDLTDAPADAVAVERARVASEGWGAQLLDRQAADGEWGDPANKRRWEVTLHSLQLLWSFGLDPFSDRARETMTRIRERVTWGKWHGFSPFFAGEVEPCINGRVVALGSYFGEASDSLVERLLGEQLADGGWNCEAERGSVRSSFHSTIDVLEGLLEYENARGSKPEVTAARARAHEYLVSRRMFRRLTTGEPIDPKWTRFAFPVHWHYDVLRGLDYLRSADAARDERLRESVELVAKRRHQNGRWPIGETHSDPVGLEMEPGRGKASRWNTLRALRVLRWYSQ